MARHRTMQSMAAEQILLAFEKGARNGNHIEWEDLELAFTLAMDAWPGIAKRVRRELDQQEGEELDQQEAENANQS